MIGFVIVMVVFSVFLMTPDDPGPRVTGEKIRLDDIIHGKFKPNPLNATWIGKFTTYNIIRIIHIKSYSEA